MLDYSEPVARLIDEFKRLPGIGGKSAQRLAFYILRRPKEDVDNFVASLLEVKEMVVEASAGGGAVTVKMRGDFEVVELKISPDTVKDGDVEMLQDLTVAALNEAHRKVEESLKGKLGGMLPPGLI